MLRFLVDNPATGEPFCERDYMAEAALWPVVERARRTFEAWRETALEDRISLIARVADLFEEQTPGIAADITGQMGKPIAQAEGEVGTMARRVRSLAEQAPAALADIALSEKPGFARRISREPLGVVLDIAAWNYPLLVPASAVVAAVLAGNTVLLKHSPRTPLCGEVFERLFRDAGAPPGLVTAIHVDHATAARLIARPEVQLVAFTGSVRGGREVYRAVSQRVLGIGLELGGKDAAYVLDDADIEQAVAGTAEGAFYNAGQSCCAVERIYVHHAVADAFVEAFVDHARAAWSIGDPAQRGTAVGPLALPDAPGRLEAQVADAVAKGGRLVVGGQRAQVDGRGRYFQTTVVLDASDDMDLMREESFGPVIGISRVTGDAEAAQRINDSAYGLTASIWGRDSERAQRIGAQLEVGTVFLNRCDYLDPELPWTGVKNSGLGSSLGHLGLQHMTRPKSWHFRR